MKKIALICALTLWGVAPLVAAASADTSLSHRLGDEDKDKKRTERKKKKKAQKESEGCGEKKSCCQKKAA